MKMAFNLSLSVVIISVFVWTACICVSQGVMGDEDKLGSSFFFYQHSTYPRDCKEIHDQCSSHNSTGVFMIKPDGSPDPFEVFCDSTGDVGGWTVIQRRFDGSINFNRSWESYTSGFGFLAQELWIGNDRLSFLTNQKRYQLVIEMTTFSDSLTRLVYDNFRISDGFSNYKLVKVGNFSGEIGDDITCCPTNTVYESCNDACQRTCGAPDDCQAISCSEVGACVCPVGFFMDGSDCVPMEQCGCYLPDELTVISEGDTYINPACTRRGVCTNGQIVWEDGNFCSDHKDCQEIYASGSTESRLYMINPTNWPNSSFEVYCNMTDGGGWTVFQRRVNGSEDFYLNWDDYKKGFGNPGHEFWLGNDKLHYLTSQKTYEIRIDLVDRDGAPYFAKFDSFRISDENDNFRLTDVGTYSGTAGDALTRHRTYQFSTKDRDNDVSGDHCAQRYTGAWWYYGCYHSNLNGDYFAPIGDARSIWWNYLPGSYGNIKFTEMKVRPI